MITSSFISSAMFYVYILFSSSLDKFYVGQTKCLEKRLADHNRGGSPFTKKGSPWKLVASFPLSSRYEAIRLESRIKSRGIKRYLQDINFTSSSAIR